MSDLYWRSVTDTKPVQPKLAPSHRSHRLVAFMAVATPHRGNWLALNIRTDLNCPSSSINVQLPRVWCKRNNYIQETSRLTCFTWNLGVSFLEIRCFSLESMGNFQGMTFHWVSQLLGILFFSEEIIEDTSGAFGVQLGMGHVLLLSI